MKFLKNNPFLLLGLVTIAIGGLYHGNALNRIAPPGSVGKGAIEVIGFIFINLTRFAHSLIANPAVAGLLSAAVGIIPYLLADWLLRRRRRARLPSGASPAH